MKTRGSLNYKINKDLKKKKHPKGFTHLAKHQVGSATLSRWLHPTLQSPGEAWRPGLGPGSEPRSGYLSSSRRAEMVLRVGPFSFFASACAIW